MFGTVYILQDESGKYYIGSTGDLTRRMHQHEIGHTQTTRNMKNPRLVFFQKFAKLTEARNIERKLKSLKRKDFLTKIVLDGFLKVAPSSFSG